MKCIKAVTLGFILLSFSQFSMAGTVVSCDYAKNKNYSGGNYDYGNAPESYGSACNATDTWQNLGADGDWNTDLPDDQYTANQDDTTNNGVQWRVQQADGTWTDFGTSATLIQGQKVQFSFQVTRSTTGNHKYDQLKAWVDWNSNGSWANDSSEKIIKRIWWKNEDDKGNANGGGTKNGDLSNWADDNWDLPDRDLKHWDIDTYRGNTEIFNSDDTSRIYYKKMTVPLNAAIGDTWMRARVVCENSLTSHSDNYNLLPTGFQDQGETEDYKLTIAKKVDVPEPSTLVVFLSGMMMLMAKRRKANSSFNA